MNTLKTLRRRYGRTTLITIGIALAIAFSTIMLSIGEAIQYSSRKIIEDTGVDILIEPRSELPAIVSQYTSFFEINHGRQIADDLVEQNSKIRAASPWAMKNLYIAKEQKDINASKPPKFSLASCSGFIPERNRYFGGIKLVSGSFLPTRNDPFYSNGTFQDGF
jgi:ABC-type antimicrobial peptide transport system permease subunit